VNEDGVAGTIEELPVSSLAVFQRYLSLLAKGDVVRGDQEPLLPPYGGVAHGLLDPEKAARLVARPPLEELRALLCRPEHPLPGIIRGARRLPRTQCREVDQTELRARITVHLAGAAVHLEHGPGLDVQHEHSIADRIEDGAIARLRVPLRRGRLQLLKALQTHRAEDLGELLGDRQVPLELLARQHRRPVDGLQVGVLVEPVLRRLGAEELEVRLLEEKLPYERVAEVFPADQDRRRGVHHPTGALVDDRRIGLVDVTQNVAVALAALQFALGMRPMELRADVLAGRSRENVALVVDDRRRERESGVQTVEEFLEFGNVQKVLEPTGHRVCHHFPSGNDTDAARSPLRVRTACICDASRLTIDCQR